MYCLRIGVDLLKHRNILFSGNLNGTHTHVSGFDGKFSHGGMCFRKDVNVFAKMIGGVSLRLHCLHLNVDFKYIFVVLRNTLDDSTQLRRL